MRVARSIPDGDGMNIFSLIFRIFFSKFLTKKNFIYTPNIYHVFYICILESVLTPEHTPFFFTLINLKRENFYRITLIRVVH